MESRGEKSIIDYIIVEKTQKKNIMDTRVYRGPEANSDHYMLAAKVKIRKTETSKNIKVCQRNHYEKVRTYKLSITEIAQKYRQEVEQKIELLPQCVAHKNVEETWQVLKEIILNAAKGACGTAKINRSKKQTSLWNKQVNMEIKKKKDK